MKELEAFKENFSETKSAKELLIEQLGKELDDFKIILKNTLYEYDKTKNEIADIMLEKEKKSKVSLERKIYNANSSVKATANIMKQAPILILVFKPKENNWIIGDSLSIGAAIEHICLRATDLGLGSLWIRDIVYTQKEIANLVGISDMELISAISIGYPDEKPKQKPRKKLNEILEWYEDGK